MAWAFSGAFLDGIAADRVTVGAGGYASSLRK
jgi:hypothetical protein